MKLKYEDINAIRKKKEKEADVKAKKEKTRKQVIK